MVKNENKLVNRTIYTAFYQSMATGDLYADMFEVNTIRKEDYEFIKDKSGEFVDVLQVCCVNYSIEMK